MIYCYIITKMSALKLVNFTNFENLVLHGIKIEIRNAFKKIKKINYKNYFLYAFDKKKLKLPSGVSTLRRKLKFYKD